MDVINKRLETIIVNHLRMSDSAFQCSTELHYGNTEVTVLSYQFDLVCRFEEIWSNIWDPSPRSSVMCFESFAYKLI